MGLHYVVVVHGIGAQRLGETPLPVVSRLAEARRAPAAKGSADVVTLGMVASGLREQGWVAFEGIPAQRPDAPLERAFLGVPAHDGDEANFRFVDIHWADLLDADVRATAQEPRVWARGLLGRLARKEGPRPPPWAEEILHSIALSFDAASLGLGWQSPALRDRLVDDYLGDVQVYGEHARTRGTAVRHFHERMSALHGALSPDEQASVKYTIVAHSLGSVMAFDALLYAAARPSARERRSPPWTRHGLPFHGYAREGDAPEEPRWLERVGALVTLGSPIDKFLTLWWYGYRHLAHPDDWMRDARELPRIAHFNYCEEQDPVGHHLDFAATSSAYGRLFSRQEDRVYVRYAIPGLAHLAYWQDADLFRWILARAIDGEPPSPDEPPLRFFDLRIYAAILRFNYLVPPTATALALAGLLAWARHDPGVGSGAIAGAAAVAAGWFGKQAIDLSVWWRQLLAAKRKGDEAASDARAGERRVDARPLDAPREVQQAIVPRAGERISRVPREAPAGMGERVVRTLAGASAEETRDLVARRLAGRAFRFVALPGLTLACFAAAILVGGAWWRASEGGAGLSLRAEHVALALSSLGTLAAWRLVIKPRIKAWQERPFFSTRALAALGAGAAVVVAAWAVARLELAPRLDEAEPSVLAPLALWADKAVLHAGAEVFALFTILGTAFVYTMLRLADVRRRLAVRAAPTSFDEYVRVRLPRPAPPARPAEEE
ncbi:MAG: hypothetical protein KF729_01975 [Sandaracinaceae bacterium]|nr:hypothetical protein [Sandaracinaceae bacterium]